MLPQLVLLALGAAAPSLAAAETNLCAVPINSGESLLQDKVTGGMTYLAAPAWPAMRRPPSLSVDICVVPESQHICWCHIQGHNTVFQNHLGQMVYHEKWSQEQSASIRECSRQEYNYLCYETIGHRIAAVKHVSGAMMIHSNFVPIIGKIRRCEGTGDESSGGQQQQEKEFTAEDYT